ncbi:nSTAND1 domain-containing NTPase [Streptomyces sp. NPDC002643]
MPRETEQGPGPEDFGRVMRRLREAASMSLSELAKASQYSKSHLSNIENGRKRPHRGLAERVDAVLGGKGELIRLCDGPARPGPRPGPCPYRGLAAFEQGDRRWFFGRDRATEVLVDRVAGTARDGGGPVMLFGASGAGKSSLLRAGLLHAVDTGALGGPDAADGPSPRVGVLVTPTARPFDTLAAALATPLGRDEPELARALRDGTPLPASAAHVLLVVDQLEEVFTLCADDGERGAYLDALCRMPLVVLAVRADFFAACLTHAGLAAAVRHPVALGPMTRAELESSVTGPAALAGVECEPGLLEALLHDLDPGGHGYDPGALPLLSHALYATWHNRTGRRLTLAGYRGTGGIRRAVAETAERTYLDLTPDQRAAARRLMLSLVQVGDEGADTRRRTQRDHLAPGPDTDTALDAFTRARLLTVDVGRGPGRGATVEITHEALLRAWPRLAGWIDTDRAGIRAHQRLAEAARAWAAAGRSPELLLQAAPLALVVQWATDHPGQAEPLEEEYLSASVRESRRGLRRLRHLLGGLAVITVLALLAAFIAHRQSARADREATASRIATMAERAAVLRATDPAFAADLAAAAYRLDRADPTGRAAVVATTALPFPTRLTGIGRQVSAFAFGPGGLMAAGSHQGLIRLWRDSIDRPRAATTHRLPGRSRQIYGLALTPDGRRLIVADTREVRVWRLRSDGLTPGRRLHRGSGTLDLELAPDGHTLAAACDDGTLRLWDLADPERPRGPTELPARAGKLHAVSLNADASRVTVGGNDGKAVIWSRTSTPLTYARTDTEAFYDHVTDTEDGDHATEGRDSGSAAEDLDPVSVTESVLSSDGRRLAVGLSDGSVWVCRLDGRGRCPAPVRAPDAGRHAAGMAFSPDDRLLAVAASDSRLVLRDPADGAVLLSLPHPTPLQSMAFAPDGRRLLVGASEGGTAHVWRLPLPILLGHHLMVTDVATHLGRGLTATVSRDATARLWHTRHPRTPSPPTVLRHAAPLTAVAIDPTGRLLATGTATGAVHLWDITRPTAPRELQQPREQRESVTALAFGGPRGTLLAAASTDDTTVVWNVDRDQEETRTPEKGRPGQGKPHKGKPDKGKPEKTEQRGPSVRLTLRLRLHDHDSYGVNDVAFHAAGRLLATAHGDRTVRVWDLAHRATGTVRTPLERIAGHEGIVTTVAFGGADGTLLASGSQDNTVRLWHVDPVRHPARRVQLKGAPHTAFLSSVQFSGDNRILMSAAEDGTLARWDLTRPTPAPSEQLRGLGEYLSAATLGDDTGRHIWTAVGTVVRGWSVHPAEADRHTCELLGSPATPAQRVRHLAGMAGVALCRD